MPFSDVIGETERPVFTTVKEKWNERPHSFLGHPPHRTVKSPSQENRLYKACPGRWIRLMARHATSPDSRPVNAQTQDKDVPQLPLRGTK